MVVCNHVLFSTLWLLITMWDVSNKILRKIQGAIQKYLWSGKEQLTHTKVSWTKCYMKKKLGALGWLIQRWPKLVYYANG